VQKASSQGTGTQVAPDSDVAVFYDPEWLGLVVGMRELWKTDEGAALALRTCTGWSKGARPTCVRTHLFQIWVLLQDVRRNYHADRAERTRRFRKVGGFRDVVKRLIDELSDQQPPQIHRRY
jgi:hypothetical protein